MLRHNSVRSERGSFLSQKSVRICPFQNPASRPMHVAVEYDRAPQLVLENIVSFPHSCLSSARRAGYRECPLLRSTYKRTPGAGSLVLTRNSNTCASNQIAKLRHKCFGLDVQADERELNKNGHEKHAFTRKPFPGDGSSLSW